jgi:hypothetical protein
MERRQFIRGLCSGVVAWPLAAYAQQVSYPRRIGILGADAAVWRPWTAALTTRLRELGWSLGENIAIEYRWAEGRSWRVSEIADEFLRQDVDVIVTYGSAVPILKQLQRQSLLSLPSRSIRSATAWCKAWLIQAAMLPERPSNSSILSANGLNCCARLSPSSAA